MYDTPAILNLQDLLGIPTSISGCQAVFRTEGRNLCAVTHLALLGVKIQEPAFWVYLLMMKAALGRFFCYIKDFSCFF